MEKTPRGVFRRKAPGESVQDWFNSTLDGIYKHYYKVLAAVVIGVLALAFLAVAAVNHYGSIRDPATCGMCHTTYYNYADYAPYPHQEPERGVTVGCGECHPYPFKEFRKSVHYTAVNGIRPGCVSCHGAPHTLGDFNRYMFLLGPTLWFKPGTVSPGAAFWNMAAPMTDQPKWELVRPQMAQKVRDEYLKNDSAPCRSCHNIDNLIAVENPDKPWVKDVHAQVKQEGKTCIQCHYNLVHAEVPWEEPEIAQGGG